MRAPLNIIILRPLSLVLGVLVLFFSLTGCKKGDAEPNQSPQTFISVEEINLTGENRLNSLVDLQWWGTDPDGVLVGYEFSFDQETWYFTRNQDSTFLFSINAGSDTIDIDFYVRAIDDQDARDATPAYLRIPLKNTPPEIAFNTDLLPVDTAFNLLTMAWEASDLDGISTIEAIEVKINDADWVSIPPSIKVAAIVPDDPKSSGPTSAKLFDDAGNELVSVEGLNLNASNDVFIRALDIADSYSMEDTISQIFVKGQVNDILLIGAHGSNPNGFYRSNMTLAGLSFDFIDYVFEDGKNQPKIWYPSFSLLLRQYESVVFYSNEVNYTNAQTNAEDIILEFASTSIQEYTDAGGKMLISTSFPNAFSTGSALFGILPIDSLSSSEGQARLPIDSAVVPIESGYPEMICNSFISGLDPFYPSSDAEAIYEANLTSSNGWTGPRTVGARRRFEGNVNLILFSVELHRLNGDLNGPADLFERIFDSDFDW